MLTTIDNANVKKQVTRNIKNPGGGWTNSNVQQLGVIANYNKYMNAVDRSDQILATNNINRKCVRWWKALFFHLIDIAIVNSYILFQENRTNSPDEPPLKRPASYSLTNFREEVVKGLCGFAEYGSPPPRHLASNLAPPSSEVSQFVTKPIPCFSEERRACVVCWQKEKKTVQSPKLEHQKCVSFSQVCREVANCEV